MKKPSELDRLVARAEELEDKHESELTDADKKELEDLGKQIEVLKSKPITLVKITPSCKRLVVCFSDNTDECRDFESTDKAMAEVRKLKEILPRFLIRDVSTGHEHWSKS